MYKTNCGRLRQVALGDLVLRVDREGVVVEGRGLIRSDDLLAPQGTVYFEWKAWPPKILGMVRDLILEAEKHVAESTSTGPVTAAQDESANAVAERAAEEKRQVAAMPRMRPNLSPGGAPLPPDLFGESGEDDDDIASSIKVESQF